MAKAYQCDRCMNFFKDNKEVTVPGASSDKIASIANVCFRTTASSATPNVIRSYELCDECMQKLVNFLEYIGQD